MSAEGVQGTAVAVAAAVLAATGPGRVHVTGVVKDLVAGAELRFSPAGELATAGGCVAVHAAGGLGEDRDRPDPDG